MRPAHDESASDNGFFETWKLATFKPRTFFSKPIGKRSRVSPVAFVLLLSFVTAGPGTAVSLALAGSEIKIGAVVAAMFFTPLGALMSVYLSALFVHGLLRLVGVGSAAPRSVEEPPEKEMPPPNPDDPYAPPRTLGAVGKPRLGPLRETVDAVAFAHAPMVFEVFGPPGQIVATIWWLVIFVVALSCVHRTSLLRSFGVTFAIVASPALFALTLRAGVIEAFKIPSGSMMPTVTVGDHIFVSKLAYGPLLPNSDQRLFSRLPPARGDVMVFKFPENKNQDFIKRSIALPGDTLEAINGRPILNGWLVPNCYVGKFGRDDSDLYVEFLEDKSYLTLYSPYGAESKGPEKPACHSTDDCELGQTCRVGICGYHQGPFKVKDNEVWVMGDNRNNSHDSRSWRGGQGAGVPFENIKGRATYVWMSFAPTGEVASDRLFVDVMGTPTLPKDADPTLGAALEKCLRERPAREQTTPPHGSR
jgi:signal peptidase I